MSDKVENIKLFDSTLYLRAMSDILAIKHEDAQLCLFLLALANENALAELRKEVIGLNLTKIKENFKFMVSNYDTLLSSSSIETIEKMMAKPVFKYQVVMR